MQKAEKERLIEYYRKQRVTGTYDLQREGTEYRRKKRQKELKSFLRLIDKKPKDKVLELGCSSGFLTKHLGKVTAIDTSKDMLRIAGQKNPKAKCIEADMFKLPFKDNSFDTIVTMRVWNHLDKRDFGRALKEVRRVLKKKGVLVFDMEESSFLRRMIHFFYKRIFKITGYKIYQYNLNQIRQTLSKHGFKIQKIIYLSHRIGRQIILRTELQDK